MTPRSLQAVIFDLWNTLISDPPGLSERRERLRLEAIGAAAATDPDLGAPPPGPEAVENAYRALLDEMAARNRRGRDMSVERRARFLVSKLKPGSVPSPALLSGIAEAFATAALAVPPPVRPGALEAVRALRGAGVRLGLVSNTGPTPGAGLREVLRRHGLFSYFAVLTFSDETGLCKPAPGIFRRTLADLGVHASSTVFVGDDAELDVAGPQRVGMLTVQVGARSLQNSADGAQPDARIDRLDELSEALRSLGFPDVS